MRTVLAGTPPARTVAFSYVNLSRRFQWALQGFDQTTFYYSTGSQFYDPAYSSLISRDDATSTRTIRGGVATGIYPLNRYRRVELSAGVYRISEQYSDANLQAYSEQYQQATYILVVQGHGALGDRVTNPLSGAGFEIELLSEQGAAFQRARHRRFSAIVLDMTLAGLNGEPLCRAIRLIGANRTTPLLTIAAESHESDRVRGLSSGADDYLCSGRAALGPRRADSVNLGRPLILPIVPL